jgi:hypothetical protein
LFNHFFRDAIPKKWFFEFPNQFTHFNHQNKLLYTMHATTLGILVFQISKFGFKTRGCETRVIDGLLFNFFEEKDRIFKTNLTLSLILWFNLWFGDCKFNRTPYKRRLENYSGYEHLTAMMQQGSIRKTPSGRSSGELEDAFRSTQRPAVLDYEELTGLSDPGPWDCAHLIDFLG